MINTYHIIQIIMLHYGNSLKIKLTNWHSYTYNLQRRNFSECKFIEIRKDLLLILCKYRKTHANKIIMKKLFPKNRNFIHRVYLLK